MFFCRTLYMRGPVTTWLGNCWRTRQPKNRQQNGHKLGTCRAGGRAPVLYALSMLCLPRVDFL